MASRVFSVAFLFCVTVTLSVGRRIHLNLEKEEDNENQGLTVYEGSDQKNNRVHIKFHPVVNNGEGKDPGYVRINADVFLPYPYKGSYHFSNGQESELSAYAGIADIMNEDDDKQYEGSEDDLFAVNEIF